MKPATIQELIVNIEKIQSIMVDASSEYKVQCNDNYYQELYQETNFMLEILQSEGLIINNPNLFSSLRDWHNYWLSNHLESYARQKHIYELYIQIFYQLEFCYYKKSLENSNNFISSLEIFYFEKLIKNIERIKSIMIDVATGKTKVEEDEASYSKIYKDVSTNIVQLQIIGLPIINPNSYRSLFHWKAYWSCELKSYPSRREFINNIYLSIINPIKQALQKNRLRANCSLNEFIQDLSRCLNTATPNPASIHTTIPAIKNTKLQNQLTPSLILPKIDDTKVYSDKNSLEERLSPTLTTPTPLSQPLFTNPAVDIVIITALSKERDAVLRYLDFPEAVQQLGRTFHKALLKTRKLDTIYQVVVICLPSMGNLQAAVATQRAITQLNPSHILLVGIAGGVPQKNSRHLGDILVGEQILYYELGKQTGSEQGTSIIQRRYETFRSPRVLLEAAKNLPAENWASNIKAQRPDGTIKNPQVHFGVVASGDKVIADPTLRGELQNHWSQLVGFEMEGAGAAFAAYQSDFLNGILPIKGLCDWGDASKNDDWQEYAAEASASFVIQLLKSAPFESKLKLDTTKSQEPTETKQAIQTLNSQELTNKTQRTSKRYSGLVKITVCRKLVKDWQALADYFEIQLYEIVTFEKGREPQHIWEWLELRDKLHQLEEALIAIGREDLIQELNK